jgi:hypothetical protein
MDDVRDPETPRTLTVLGAARYVPCHPDTVARAARSGELPSGWHFGRRIFDVRDLDAWIASKAQRIGRRR